MLTTLLGASPFLSEVLIRNPEYFHWLQQELGTSAPDLIGYRVELDLILSHDANLERREILRIAGPDLLDKDTLRSSTQQLSNLADIVIERAIAIVRDQMAAERNEIVPDSFVVIGMGKLGGSELNYSSDVDLVYLYDTPDDAPASTHDRFQRFGRQLTSVLSEYTDEGCLYRVDLRLRPMGKRGNVVYSLQQSAQYYETMGETFERFAMIKARPIAGDLELGRRFLGMVRPFVYRKYLDHAAIEELARYKARSDREHAKRETGDRNVKVGRGGIREVDLFTQVFQLIYGGTQTELQDPNTISALQTIARLGFIDDTTLHELQDAYGFLRRLEHRLQIVQEGQTHTLSDEAVELLVTARRVGFSTETELLSTIAVHRNSVHVVYSNLLERRSEDAEFHGRQLFRLLSGELSRTTKRPRMCAHWVLRTHTRPWAPSAGSIMSRRSVTPRRRLETSWQICWRRYLARSPSAVLQRRSSTGLNRSWPGPAVWRRCIEVCSRTTSCAGDYCLPSMRAISLRSVLADIPSSWTSS